MNFIKKLILFLLIFTSASACSSLVIPEAPVATPTPEDAMLVTNADIDYAYRFAEDIFTGTQWERTLTTQRDRVMVTWIKSNSGNLAYLDYRIYPEGYTQDMLDWYYSDESFETILYANYDDLSPLAECTNGSLQFYAFSASYEGTPYLIYDWVDTSNPKRIADVSIIFKTSEQTELEQYAEAVFPSLPRCE